jgi:class 3 adenylate cyclase/lipopolysaccharide biosynthesis regulator YciM
MRSFILAFGFIILYGLVYAQNAEIKRLNAKAWEIKFNEPEKAMAETDSALKLALGKEIPELIETYKIRGVVNLLTGKNIEAIQEFTEALRLANLYTDSLAIGKIKNNLGTVYRQLANYKEAVRYSYESLQIMESLNNNEGMIAAYSNLGNVYSAQENYSKAIEFYERAIGLSEKNKNTSINNLASLKSDLAAAYKNDNKPQKSIQYFNEALTLFTKENNVIGLNNQMVNLGAVYIDLRDFNKAEEYLNKGLAGKSEIGDEQGIAQIYFNLGELNRLKKMNAEAKKFYIQSLQLATENENLHDQLLAVGGLANVEEASGNYKSALAWQQKYQLYKDSLNNASTYDQISTFQTLYETERRDKEITLLNKEKEVQELSIRRKNLMQLFWITCFLAAVVFSIVFFIQRKRIAKEKKSSENLLLNILPAHVANELKTHGKASSRPFEQATVLFTDFCDFTKISEKLSPEQLVDELHEYFTAFDALTVKHNIEKIKTIGDAYMAVGGLQGDFRDAARRVVCSALDLQAFMEAQKRTKAAQNKPFFEIRIGIHTGPLVAGIVGTHKFQYDVWGDTVNTASRLESAGERGKINISENTWLLVQDYFTSEPRGNIQTKGKGPLTMYFITEEKSKKIG